MTPEEIEAREKARNKEAEAYRRDFIEPGRRSLRQKAAELFWINRHIPEPLATRFVEDLPELTTVQLERECEVFDVAVPINKRAVHVAQRLYRQRGLAFPRIS